MCKKYEEISTSMQKYQIPPLPEEIFKRAFPLVRRDAFFLQLLVDRQTHLLDGRPLLLGVFHDCPGDVGVQLVDGAKQDALGEDLLEHEEVGEDGKNEAEDPSVEGVGVGWGAWMWGGD